MTTANLSATDTAIVPYELINQSDASFRYKAKLIVVWVLTLIEVKAALNETIEPVMTIILEYWANTSFSIDRTLKGSVAKWQKTEPL